MLTFGQINLHDRNRWFLTSFDSYAVQNSTKVLLKFGLGISVNFNPEPGTGVVFENRNTIVNRQKNLNSVKI